MMNIRERAYATIKKRAFDRRQQRLETVERLRRDDYFDDLIRSANSLRWDRLLAPASDREAAERLLAETEIKISEYLSQKGYTEGILRDTESCVLCHDTGVFEGKMCRCAEEVRQKLEERRSPMICGVPDSLEEIDLSFYGDRRGEYKKYIGYIKKKMVEGELSYAVIGGKTGTGKSYVGCAAAREYMKKGYDVLAISALDMNQKFLAYHCAFLENKQEIWDELVEPDLLYVDDLGVEPLLNNVTKIYLYALLVARIEKKTIITTNYDIVKLEERYGERIVSRLLEKRRSAVMTFEGEDLRF